MGYIQKKHFNITISSILAVSKYCVNITKLALNGIKKQIDFFAKFAHL
jgi:hypothetical protein